MAISISHVDKAFCADNLHHPRIIYLKIDVIELRTFSNVLEVCGHFKCFCKILKVYLILKGFHAYALAD